MGNTISYIGCDTTCNTGALRESLLLNIYIYSNVSLTDLPCFTRFKFSVHLIYIRERYVSVIERHEHDIVASGAIRRSISIRIKLAYLLFHMSSLWKHMRVS